MSIKSKLKKIRDVVIRAPQIYANIVISSPSDLLQDEVILITGGGSGIGKAIAQKAISQKAMVVIVGRNEDKLKRTCQELNADRCRYVVADINVIEDFSLFFNKVEAIYNKKITAFVNNAGVYIDKNPFNFSKNDYELVINTNLKTPMLLIQHYVEYCVERHIVGNVVVVASNRGMFGDHGPYGVSKAGIINYVEGMAREFLKFGFRINAIAPGMTASEINNIDVKGNLYTSSARGKRVLLPEEIAEVACFLLGKSSKCINGVTIPCDEGDRLR